MKNQKLGTLLEGKTIGFILILPIGLMLAALIPTDKNFYLVFFSVVITILMFSWKGVQIDSENKRFKKYRSFLFYKSGSWESLVNYKHFKIRRIVKGNQLNYGAVITATYNSNSLGLYLENPVDKKSVLIKKGKAEELKSFIEELKNELPEITLSNKV